MLESDLHFCVSTTGCSMQKVYYTIRRRDVFCLFDVASMYAVDIEVVLRDCVGACMCCKGGRACRFLLFSSFSERILCLFGLFAQEGSSKKQKKEVRRHCL